MPRAEMARLPFDQRWVSICEESRKAVPESLGLRIHRKCPRRLLEDLGSGGREYRVMLGTHARPTVHPLPGLKQLPLNPGEFRDGTELTLVAGQTARFDPQYVPLHAGAFSRPPVRDRANHQARRPARERCEGLDHISRRPLWFHSVFTGKRPKSGEIELKNVTDRVPHQYWTSSSYSVWGRSSTGLGMDLATSSAPETFTFSLPPAAEDMVPDIDLVNVATGKPIKLSSLRGSSCVDLWLTWCPYCQETMRNFEVAAGDKRWARYRTPSCR